MTAKEWLSVIQQAADYPHHLTPLIEKYGEMLLSEQQEDKISDSEIEKLADVYVAKQGTHSTPNITKHDFIHGFKACLQKGSEDNFSDINAVSILKHIRQQLIDKDAEIERLRLNEDKIAKTISWVDERISFIGNAKRGASVAKHLYQYAIDELEEMKQFLQSL